MLLGILLASSTHGPLISGWGGDGGGGGDFDPSLRPGGGVWGCLGYKLWSAASGDRTPYLLLCESGIVAIAIRGHGSFVAKQAFIPSQVTQYSCDYDNLAPDGCTQYFFGATSQTVQVRRNNYFFTQKNAKIDVFSYFPPLDVQL